MTAIFTLHRDRRKQIGCEAIALPLFRRTTAHVWLFALTVLIVPPWVGPTPVNAAGGSLTLICQEESDQSPTITRAQIWRGNPAGKMIPIRRTVSAGIGVVLDRSTELTLADGPYAFRMIRGPEYRVITGTFTLERSSLDDHTVQLPRMVSMIENGWTSGDCLVVAAPQSLPLRMASEDLHLATTLGDMAAAPIPHRDKDDPIGCEPIWISTDAVHHDGLVIYGDQRRAGKSAADDAESDKTSEDDTTAQQASDRQASDRQASPDDLLPIANVVAAKNASTETRVAIENPFAWPLPVWLASERVDGIFVIGDWLRLDRKVLSVKTGRKPPGGGLGGGQAVGRWAEEIYRHCLDAGLRLPPLAGGGTDSAKTPVGYNRLYVAQMSSDAYNDAQIQRVESPKDWWAAAWQGQSVATNGPLLRPMLGGKIPGHVFKGRTGEVLQIQPELSLSVRDPVEYLEVIHNNKVHYSARLDEFAKAGGRIPPLNAKESGWVIMRVITLYEDHYRAAISAPWYIDFDDQRRVSKTSVDFFQQWLADYETQLKKHSADSLQAHAPYIRAARQFWQQKSAVAVD
ncbi:hypothetical protein [Stieleria marina]|uniref:Secreted protein n=1 Tax=Stieleria marina TaxID=1930275 RepID=A0A517NWZ3_9BACT|nr:hypothetical protein K239x_36440 [Planctomycetes bacterium K23_9]